MPLLHDEREDDDGMTTSKREKGYTCQCGNNITVIGKATDDAKSLRRVDWTLEGSKAVCRDCNK